MLVLDAINSGTYSMYHHLHLKKSASCKARFAYSIDIPKTYSQGKTIYIFMNSVKRVQKTISDWMSRMSHG